MLDPGFLVLCRNRRAGDNRSACAEAGQNAMNAATTAARASPGLDGAEAAAVGGAVRGGSA